MDREWRMQAGRDGSTGGWSAGDCVRFDQCQNQRLPLRQQSQGLIGLNELNVADGCVGRLGGQIVVRNGAKHRLRGAERVAGVLQAQAGLDFEVEGQRETWEAAGLLHRRRRVARAEVIGRRLPDLLPKLSERAEAGIGKQIFAGVLIRIASEAGRLGLIGGYLERIDLGVGPVLHGAAHDVQRACGLVVCGLGRELWRGSGRRRSLCGRDAAASCEHDDSKPTHDTPGKLPKQKTLGTETGASRIC
jgi:hypothetical protein